MELIIDKLVAKNVMPAYFIGAGISRRYIEKYPNWEELLKNIAMQIKLSELQFSTLEEMAKSQSNDNRCSKNALIAKMLKEKFNSNIVNDDGYISKVFNESQLQYLENNSKIDKFKYLVSLNFDNYIVTKRKFKKNEISLLKNMLANSSSIITTNYDDFLESYILENKFQVFSSQSSYYLPDVYGYGEIYKIHGTSTDPNSLIITVEDYSNYNSVMYLSTAKIISIICEQPLIFLGYSLDDENIKEILHSIIQCLSPEQLKSFEKNLILINWKENEKEILQHKFSIEYNNKNLTITSLETDNFQRLFTILTKIQPAFKSTTIRKMNKMYKKAIFSKKPLDYISISDAMIKDMDTDKYVISFAQQENLGGLPKSEIYLEVLMRKKTHKAEKVLSECAWARSEYFPMYYFLNQLPKNKKDEFMSSDTINKCHCNKVSNYNKLETVTLKLDDTKSINYVKTTDDKLYKIIKVLVSNYYFGHITEKVYIKSLQELYHNNNSVIGDSNMKRAICLIDYKKFKGI